MSGDVDARLERAIEAYVAGENVQVAASRFDIGPRSLTRVLKERGLMRDATASHIIGAKRMWAERPRPSILPDELRARYESGESVASLARHFNVDRVTITRRLQQARVALRSMSEQGRIEMAKLSPMERQLRTLEAHMSNRGRMRSDEELHRHALTRQRTRGRASPYEDLLATWLAERGITAISQQAVGRYNLDLGIGSVAIEIHGGGWHGTGIHYASAPKRMRYLLDQGWSIIVVWNNSRHDLSRAGADTIVRLLPEAQAHPGTTYVIGGDGYVFPPASYYYRRALALIPASPGISEGGV